MCSILASGECRRQRPRETERGVFLLAIGAGSPNDGVATSGSGQELKGKTGSCFERCEYKLFSSCGPDTINKRDDQP